MNRPLRLAECSQPISWVNATLLTIRQQHYRIPFAAVGSRFIVPTYTYLPRIRNPLGHIWQSVSSIIAIRSEYIHGTFATCSLSVCYIFAMQKYGFCATKVWFLVCKNPLFTLQKPPFWRARSGFLQSLN